MRPPGGLHVHSSFPKRARSKGAPELSRSSLSERAARRVSRLDALDYAGERIRTELSLADEVRAPGLEKPRPSHFEAREPDDGRSVSLVSNCSQNVYPIIGAQ